MDWRATYPPSACPSSPSAGVSNQTVAGNRSAKLEGLDHTGAMQAAKALSVIRPWLSTTLGV